MLTTCLLPAKLFGLLTVDAVLCCAVQATNINMNILWTAASLVLTRCFAVYTQAQTQRTMMQQQMTSSLYDKMQDSQEGVISVITEVRAWGVQDSAVRVGARVIDGTVTANPIMLFACPASSVSSDHMQQQCAQTALTCQIAQNQWDCGCMMLWVCDQHLVLPVPGND